MKPASRFAFVLLTVLAWPLGSPAVAGERVPGETWMAYADSADAGFDAEDLCLGC